MKTADRITLDLISELNGKGNTIVLPNYYINQWECDVFAITKSGYKIEYEIKISKEDLLKDFGKRDYNYNWHNRSREYFYKHELIKEGKRVNRFFYVITPNLIEFIDQIPKHLGVIVAEPLLKLSTNITVERIKERFKDTTLRFYNFILKRPAKILNKEKDKVDYKQIAEKVSFRENSLFYENRRIRHQEKIYEKKYKDLLKKHTELKRKHNEPAEIVWE